MGPELLDTPLVAVVRVMPIYPERALKERVRGLVEVAVLVSETGEPARVTVLKPAREDLTRAAVEAARQWRFKPPTRQGHPVRTSTVLRFPFEGIAFAQPTPGAEAQEIEALPTATPSPGRGQETWRLRTPTPERGEETWRLRTPRPR